MMQTYLDENGQLHKLDGPALIYVNGDKSWYKHGRRHRIDGPAIEWKKVVEWYFEGKKFVCSSQKEFEKHLKLILFL